jgi:hypothetical protein
LRCDDGKHHISETILEGGNMFDIKVVHGIGVESASINFVSIFLTDIERNGG